MTTTHQAHAVHGICNLIAAFDAVPAGIDPDFDDGLQELERQFAELRLAFNPN